MKNMLLIFTSMTLMFVVTTANAEYVGEMTYKMACSKCHDTGEADAPKYGDKAAWKDRIAKGNNILYEHAIKGFNGATGFKIPKGGRSDLSDADVKAAVDYMLSGVK